MHQQIMQAAISNLNLGQGSAATRDLLSELANVTGLSVVTLLSVKHRMTQLGSFAPLRSLLADPEVPKAPGLRYKISVHQMQKGILPKATKRAQACRLILDFESSRGRVQIAVFLRIEEKAAATAGASSRQVARLSVSFRLLKGAVRRTIRQAMTIAAKAPQASGSHAKAA